MNSKIKLGLIGAGDVVCTGIGYWIGMDHSMKFLSRQLVIELNSNQAMLEYDRIQDARKINLLLSRGCVSEALAKTDITVDMNTTLLADQFKGKLNPSVSKYISDSDPDLLRSLNGFKSKYGGSWPEKECVR